MQISSFNIQTAWLSAKYQDSIHVYFLIDIIRLSVRVQMMLHVTNYFLQKHKLPCLFWVDSNIISIHKPQDVNAIVLNIWRNFICFGSNIISVVFSYLLELSTHDTVSSEQTLYSFSKEKLRTKKYVYCFLIQLLWFRLMIDFISPVFLWCSIAV